MADPDLRAPASTAWKVVSAIIVAAFLAALFCFTAWRSAPPPPPPMPAGWP